ncbi:uncharacterized protein F5891DRAFT_980442 [Suillus fuscotomentosus]|uniref:Uncharacterized protein n=1 Tax=Suillus fuscotomentosus TaxID=1912939 RepID=A0AAD4HJP1_9AGAM|nr:uncharacterized protein F5891DRAFT_980442 [Suillus fuscotomentosus]KAG1900150.1 hypothetical protein F5891DRAFT_980442 [Suillus fuscotomentosus]
MKTQLHSGYDCDQNVELEGILVPTTQQSHRNCRLLLMKWKGKVMLTEEKKMSGSYAINVLKKKFIIDNDEVERKMSILGCCSGTTAVPTWLTLTIEQIGDAQVGCSSGKVVKSFHFTGVHNLDCVMLWIWRDLFIVMLADGTKCQKSAIPDMLDDICSQFGWNALKLLLYGGQKCKLH